MAFAYYNEIDPYAAQWLRNLIAAGHIADGCVDERSISDVRPSDLAGFTQCHFFAGIGVWSHALRRAGWPDDRPIWTGSCPCQPFSAAGAGAGFADERHLWPHWYHLIRVCRPPVLAGEQVASKNTDAWVDLVCADLEAMDYAFGCVPFPAAGIGAPHIRDRNYWIAEHLSLSLSLSQRLGDGDCERSQGHAGNGDDSGGRSDAPRPVAAASISRELADSPSVRWLGRWPSEACIESGPFQRSERFRDAGGLADDDDDGLASPSVAQFRHPEHHPEPCRDLGGGLPGPTNGLWRDADWLFCRDGKWRPVEPGTFPLAHGAASRVGRLRAYGNAITAPAAEAVIATFLEHERAVAGGVPMLIGHNGGPTFEDILG